MSSLPSNNKIQVSNPNPLYKEQNVIRIGIDLKKDYSHKIRKIIIISEVPNSLSKKIY